MRLGWRLGAAIVTGAIALVVTHTSSGVLAGRAGGRLLSGPESVAAVIAGGNNHSVALTTSGAVWAWGRNGEGQLGDTTTTSRTIPGLVSLSGTFVAIAAGEFHTLALKQDGTLWGWGANTNGQLGQTPDSNAHPTPAQIAVGATITAIAAGGQFSLALKANGELLAWGANGAGQLGNGTTTPRSQPALVLKAVGLSLSGITAIAAGSAHGLARTSDGRAWAWGDNALGELGLGHQTNQTFAQAITALDANPPTDPSTVVGVAAGNSHSLVRKSDASLWSFGWGSVGQLGLGTTPLFVSAPQKVPSFAVSLLGGGGDFSVALNTDVTPSAWAWGNGGRLGVGDSNMRLSPVAMITPPGFTNLIAISAALGHGLAVASDLSVWAWGTNQDGQVGDGTSATRLIPTQIADANFLWKVGTPLLSAADGTYAAALSVTATSATSGATLRYTLTGIDPVDTDPVVPPTGVPISQSATLKVRGWLAPQRGPSNVATAVYTLQVPTPTFTPPAGRYLGIQNVTLDVSPRPSGGVTEIHYRLDGLDPTTADPWVAPGGATVPVPQSLTFTAKAFRTGWDASAVGTAVYVIQATAPTFNPPSGRYASPQSVTPSTTTPLPYTMRCTTDGREPTDNLPACTIPIPVNATTTLKAKVWKDGWAPSDTAYAGYWIPVGTVGAPTITPGTATYSTAQIVTIGTATGAADLRYTLDGTDPTPASKRYEGPFVVAMTTTVKARAYEYSWTPSAVTTATLTVTVTGQPEAPSLTPGSGTYAVGPAVTVTGPAGTTLYFTVDGRDPATTDQTITTGTIYTVAKSLVLKVRAWNGTMLGPVRRADYFVTGALAGGERHSLALKANGTVWGWGANFSGQAGPTGVGNWVLLPTAVPGFPNMVAIATKSVHSLAVQRVGSDWAVWAFGDNSYGQLGNGQSGGSSGQLVRVIRQDGLPISAIAVAAGSTHSLALTPDGQVYAWGHNDFGQLGIGVADTQAHTKAVLVPGLSGVTAIVAGRTFSLALQSDGSGGGSVWAWGDGALGQIGDGGQAMRTTPVQVTGLPPVSSLVAGLDYAVAVGADGTAWAWGADSAGQLGDGTTVMSRITPVPVRPLANTGIVSAGSQFTLATDRTQRLWAWGDDSLGQLGVIPVPPVSPPYPVLAATGLGGVLAIGTGSAHALAERVDGSVWAWGSNLDYQLGDGGQVSRTLPGPVVDPAGGGFFLVDNASLAADPDGDGLPTWLEYQLGSDPFNPDTNGDGIPDGIAYALGISLTNPDMDGDGLANWVERQIGTDPFNPDTDGDGVPDGADCFPLDPTRWLCLPFDPNDHVAPIITLLEPFNARRIQ